jgi:NTP pyrophosphatase (non-canonical NTP hydrolase)
MFDAPILSDEYLLMLHEAKEHLTEHGGLTLQLQVIKLQEECGEVAAALIGALGANPRKGETHTVEDVATEFADVAMTAMLGIVLCGVDPGELLRLQGQKVQSSIKKFDERNGRQ